ELGWDQGDALLETPMETEAVLRPAPIGRPIERRRRITPLGLFAFAVYAFLYAPILVLVAFSFNRGRLTAQWEGFTLAWYGRLLENAQILGSLRNSLIVGFAATAASTVFGTLAAVAFHRHRFRRQEAWDALVTLPIVVPEIVLASSLVLLFAAA